MDPQPTGVSVQSIAGGGFRPIAPYIGIVGRALMVRRIDGKTDLSVELTGLIASTMYTAHLHAAPCQYGGGGGHYKIDPSIVDAVETNELWLRGTTSTTGALLSDGSWSHVTRGEALSIVVHDPASGAKMACADLIEHDVATVELAGTIKPFADAAAGDMTIAGSVKASRTNAGTTLTLSLNGLNPNAIGYISHVHAEPCAVAMAGGHYKLDPTMADGMQSNELWLPISNYAAGTASSMLDTAHMIRPDAQSLVVHRTLGDGSKPKVACADLTRTTAHVPFETTGSAVPLSAAAGLSLTGTAIMTRKLTGVTELALVMTGLTPQTRYAAHVHTQSCAVESGGGHFRFDRAVTDASAANEIWLELTTDAEGTAHDATWVPKIAGAAATSVVVHGPDNARLACIDLL